MKFRSIQIGEFDPSLKFKDKYTVTIFDFHDWKSEFLRLNKFVSTVWHSKVSQLRSFLEYQSQLFTKQFL